jgi:hypothetical protein
MEITIRMPKPLLILIGAMLFVGVGAAVAHLLPTPLEGLLNGERVYQPTSVGRYLLLSGLGLGVYAALVTLMTLVRRRR